MGVLDPKQWSLCLYLSYPPGATGPRKADPQPFAFVPTTPGRWWLRHAGAPWDPFGSQMCVSSRRTLGFVLTRLVLVSMLARTGYSNAGLKNRPSFLTTVIGTIACWVQGAFRENPMAPKGGRQDVRVVAVAPGICDESVGLRGSCILARTRSGTCF